MSQTFHGRDILAPAAAHLAAGIPLDRLGPLVGDPLRLSWPSSRRDGEELLGEVIGSDRFGNLLTTVTIEELRQLDPAIAVSVLVGDRRLGGLVSCYAEGREGAGAPIIGSSGRLEIFVRGGSARALLGADRGTRVRVRRLSNAPA